MASVSRVASPVVQLIAVYAGDPHVTLRVSKQWSTHKEVVFKAICESYRKDPILLGFFPVVDDFIWTGKSVIPLVEASKAFINVRSNPVLCIKHVFKKVLIHTHDESSDPSSKTRSSLSTTKVGTLDRSRLTRYFKMRTVQLFIEHLLPGKLRGATPSQIRPILMEICPKPNIDPSAMEESTKQMAKFLTGLISGLVGDLVSYKRSEGIVPLYYLPKQFGSLTDLERLELPGERFAALPSSIGKYAKLQVLDLNRSPLFVLPKEIGQCKELRKVDLTSTNILHLDELDQCPKLEKIVLTDSQLKEIQLTPRTVALLKRLNMEIPQREKNPLADEVYKLLLPPEKMDEVDLEELAGSNKSPSSGQ